MTFATEITLHGPLRAPAQMLANQLVNGHASLHDTQTAASLGLGGAPIEGPTHFSQFDPLAVLAWRAEWFEHGCISSHFRTMVTEGERVRAYMTLTGPRSARIEARKEDGTPVLEGTASVGPDYGVTRLDEYRAAQGDPGDLFILDQLRPGMRESGGIVTMSADQANGELYPFSLADKLQRITEPHPWYHADGARLSPWGHPVVPFEMLSVLAYKSRSTWPIRQPAVGLFLDLEIRVLDGPVFQNHPYRIEREIVGLSQSRRTESYWVSSTLYDTASDTAVARVLLHQGLFKASYAAYPSDRLS
jgi:hypothetical protein